MTAASFEPVVRAFRDPGINWVHYNIEAAYRGEEDWRGGAVSLRVHNTDVPEFEERLTGVLGKPIEMGRSCPIAWVDYEKVEPMLRDTVPIKPILDVIGKGGVNLAWQCNLAREKRGR